MSGDPLPRRSVRGSSPGPKPELNLAESSGGTRLRVAGDGAEVPGPRPRRYAHPKGKPSPNLGKSNKKLALRGVVWVISDTCGYDGTVRSPAACR
jgi:hypothetical protein